MFAYNFGFQLFMTIQYSVVIVIALLLGLFLRDKKDFIKRIPVYVVGGIIIVLEIHKQFRNALGYDYTSLFGFVRGITDTFTRYALPFHFCSFFIVWILLSIVFVKVKRMRIFFENMAFLWSAIILIVTFVNPQAIYGDTIPLVVSGGGEVTHTVAFHSLVALYFGVVCSLRTYSFELKKVWHAPVSIVAFSSIAIPAAHILKENYCNILETNNAPFLNPIFEKGYVVYNGFLVLLGCVASIAIYLLIYGIEKLRDKAKYPMWFFYGYVAMIPSMVILYLISKSIGCEVLEPFYGALLIAIGVACLAPGIIKNYFLKEKVA